VSRCEILSAGRVHSWAKVSHALRGHSCGIQGAHSVFWSRGFCRDVANEEIHMGAFTSRLVLDARY
jgi:hypothetical protein